MKRICFIAIAMLSLIAQAKETLKAPGANSKVNEKLNLFVAQDRFAVVTPICNGCNAAIIEACYRYTSTYQNEAICLEVRPTPSTIEACYRGTRSYSAEAECLRGRSSAAVINGCVAYTSSYQNEALCIRLNVSPRDAEACYRYTSTYALEADCLRQCAR